MYERAKSLVFKRPLITIFPLRRKLWPYEFLIIYKKKAPFCFSDLFIGFGYSNTNCTESVFSVKGKVCGVLPLPRAFTSEKRFYSNGKRGQSNQQETWPKVKNVTDK